MAIILETLSFFFVRRLGQCYLIVLSQANVYLITKGNASDSDQPAKSCKSTQLYKFQQNCKWTANGFTADLLCEFCVCHKLTYFSSKKHTSLKANSFFGNSTTKCTVILCHLPFGKEAEYHFLSSRDWFPGNRFLKLWSYLIASSRTFLACKILFSSCFCTNTIYKINLTYGPHKKQKKKCLQIIKYCKMFRFISSCTSTMYRRGLCSTFIHSTWLRTCKSWSGPLLSAYAQRYVFAWRYIS